LNEPSVFQRLEGALDHLANRADHRSDLVLRVLGTRAGQLFDECLCSTRAVDEESADASDNCTEREILNHLFVSAKAGGKEADDLDGRVGMFPQTIEQVALRNEDNGALGHRHRVRRLRLIVEYRDVAERASWTEYARSLTPLHIRFGIGVVLSLWALAAIAWWKTTHHSLALQKCDRQLIQRELHAILTTGTVAIAHTKDNRVA
jgi:hypothetical protein